MIVVFYGVIKHGYTSIHAFMYMPFI